MKKLVFTYSFSIIFLSIFIGFSALVVKPLINKVASELEIVQERYFSLLEDRVGVSFSYESLSPSIFAGIRMNNIQISDSLHESSLISIESIRLHWNLLHLFSDTPTDALGDLVINGFSADYEQLQQNGVVQRILQLTSEIQSSGMQETIVTQESVPSTSSDEDLQQVIQRALEPIFSLPINVLLKNTTLKYSGNNIHVETFFSKIDLFDNDTSGQINFNINGQVSLESKGSNFSFGKLLSKISLKGHFRQNLENSFAQISVSSYQNSDYHIPRFDIYTSFENNVVVASVMQRTLPFSIEFLYDVLGNQINVSFMADNFYPFELVSFRGENEILRKLEGSRITGEYNLAYNLSSKETKYDATGYTVLSPLLLGEELKLDYSISGNENTLSVYSFDALSDNIKASYSGSIAIETLIPSGVITIDKITVPSGNTLSSEIYLDTLGNNLVIFAPQVLLGDKTLTALQIDIERSGESVDFIFEVSDYSRLDASVPGVIHGNGSYDFASDQFLQVEVLTESFFLASVTEILLWYLPAEQAQSIAVINSSLEPYIFSLNAFFSSDFDTYAYSLPYAIIANTQRDDEFLLFSANGNETLFQLPTFNLSIAGQSIQAEVSGDLGSGNSEVFFNSSVFFNSFPYSFSGVYMPEEYVMLTGDYNLNVTVDFLENLAFNARGQTQSMPISINDTLLSLSFDTNLNYVSSQNWSAAINAFEIENVTSNSILRPRLYLAGDISTNGAFFNEIYYSDDMSALEGVIASSWSINESVLENATFNLSLADSFSNEKYELNMSAFNLNGVSFDDAELLENIFFSADALIQDSPAGRFANFQTESNTINAQLTAQGSLENPSVNLNVEKSSFLLASQKAEFSGNVLLEDYTVTANDVDIVLGEIGVYDIGGSISLSDFEGYLNGNVAGRLANESYFAEKTFSSPFNLSLLALTDNNTVSFLDKSFKLDLVFDKITSTFLPSYENYSVEVIRTPGRFDLTAGNDGEVFGYLLDSGEIQVSAKDDFFVQFDGFGILENNELTMVLENIHADAQDFSSLVDLPVFSLHSGVVVGSGTLTGPLNDLQINGSLRGANIEVSIPDYVGERLICADIDIAVAENVFSAQNVYFTAQDTQTGVFLDVELSMEQLIFTYILLNIKTEADGFVKGRYIMPYGSFEGLAQTDLYIYVGSDFVEVRGDIVTEETEAIITLATAQNITEDIDIVMDAIVDLTITVNNQSQFYFPSKNNPVIRGLVNQVKPLVIQLDTRYGTSLITGEFVMRGGEILYLNRTFFARNASAVFNETVEDFNPRLTASAEIRERDKDGNPVRIMLTVDNQPLLQLDPIFDSIPVMSEQDIMTLLGQIILGSSEDINPVALLGGLADYGTQLAVFRGLEDNARDFLNLDIFSFRTMFLQNAFVYALDSAGGQTLSVGDFLDSTTVYVGKFLNETLYADAMLSLVYDDERQNFGLGGLVFQPEFGLELPSPFATIRWGIAPDLTEDWRLLVPFTSISFSWKFDL